MAIVTSYTRAPGTLNASDGFGNLILDPQIALGLLTTVPVFGGSGTQVTWGLSDFAIRFTASAGFGVSQNQLVGTVNKIELFSSLANLTLEAQIDGLALDWSAWSAAMRDGDTDAMNALLYGGADTMTGGAGEDVFHGGLGADLLRGGAAQDQLYGELGADQLYGEGGDDLLSGGAGNDLLLGGLAADTLMGGNGADTLEGGAGRDLMIGGLGADRFVFRAITDSSADVSARDIVRDFRSDELDKLNFAPIDADSTLAGNQAFSFIGNDAFAENSPGTLRWSSPAANQVLVELNTDNDALAEMSVLLVVLPSVTATDFIL